jgi:ABC-type molybdate transport system permease subunit
MWQRIEVVIIPRMTDGVIIGVILRFFRELDFMAQERYEDAFM